jgi:hypothetical protein
MNEDYWNVPTFCSSVHQGLKAIYGDKNIHSLMGVAKEKVGDLLLNMCVILQSNSCDNISRCFMDYCTFIYIWALTQMGTKTQRTGRNNKWTQLQICHYLCACIVVWGPYLLALHVLPYPCPLCFALLYMLCLATTPLCLALTYPSLNNALGK